MKINFKGKEIELKYSMRALLAYENMADKTFENTSLTASLVFFYCTLITSAKDYSITWDDFMDYVDENQDVLTEFAEWLVNVQTNQNKLKKA